jgi:hypothetical protein
MDIIISYKRGAAMGFIRPVSKTGQEFLWNNPVGQRVNNTVMASPAEILYLISKMTNVNARWSQSKH